MILPWISSFSTIFTLILLHDLCHAQGFYIALGMMLEGWLIWLKLLWWHTEIRIAFSFPRYYSKRTINSHPHVKATLAQFLDCTYALGVLLQCDRFSILAKTVLDLTKSENQSHCTNSKLHFKRAIILIKSKLLVFLRAFLIAVWLKDMISFWHACMKMGWCLGVGFPQE